MIIIEIVTICYWAQCVAEKYARQQQKVNLIFYLYTYLLLTAIRPMAGGSVYSDHIFNKETAPNSHGTAQYIARNVHSTIQVYTSN
jgi:hypothetical protein